MILSFKPEFKEKILDGIKIHTIRPEPSGRWRKGMKIHFATGARTSYECFNDRLRLFVDLATMHGRRHSAYLSHLQTLPKFDGFVCMGVQDIEIKFDDDFFKIIIDGKELATYQECLNFAQNDGFDNHLEMLEFFQWEYYPKQPTWHFKGKLIHWTDKLY